MDEFQNIFVERNSDASSIPNKVVDLIHQRMGKVLVYKVHMEKVYHHVSGSFYFIFRKETDKMTYGVLE